MRTHHLALILGLSAALNSGCSRSQARSSNAQAAEVRAVMDQFFDYAKRQDWDAVGTLMAPDFEIYTDSAESYAKQEYLKLLKSDNLEPKKMALHDERVTVSGDGTIAWMTYKGYFENIEKGKLVKVETAETMLFRRDSGTWKIARGHASIRDVTGK